MFEGSSQVLTEGQTLMTITRLIIMLLTPSGHTSLAYIQYLNKKKSFM